MYINEIKETFLDYPDDSSLAVIVFFEGCKWNCPGCQNHQLQTQDPNHKHTTVEAAEKILAFLKRSHTNKLVLSGGDPFYDTECALRLIDYLEIRGFDLCVYTGSNIEQVMSFYDDYENKYHQRLQKPLYLKCGLFRSDMLDPNRGKTENAFTLASTNQKFYKLVNGEYIQISNDNILTYGES